MIFSNNQLIFPEVFRHANFTISPFSRSHLKMIEKIQNSELQYENLLIEKFGKCLYTMSGKEAIEKALSFYKLKNSDEVYLVTTSGNKYVSSCVTNAIEKHCKWSRDFNPAATKLIFVVHEFGTIYKDAKKIIEYNLPIIEDFAMSMFSSDTSDLKIPSDFKIYSLPKFFPVQFGGILKYCNESFLFEGDFKNLSLSGKYLEKVTAYFLSFSEEIIQKRKRNYQYFTKLFEEIDIAPRLLLNDQETPSVFMFQSDHIDLDELKVFLQQNGIECSKFYGENSFFIPVHQELDEFDMRYIVNLIKYFINEN